MAGKMNDWWKKRERESNLDSPEGKKKVHVTGGVTEESEREGGRWKSQWVSSEKDCNKVRGRDEEEEGIITVRERERGQTLRSQRGRECWRKSQRTV